MRASVTALLHHAAACRSTGGSLARSGVSCVRTMASGVGRGRGGGGAAKANAADGAAAADQPKVVLLGRANVGKSSLFNRLVGRRAALVMDTPSGHVTRDYREGDAALGDLRFRAVDTSGLEPFMGASTLQGRAAALTARVVASADAAVLVLDARAGVTPADAALAAWLRTAVQGPGLVVAAVNKAERARETPAVAAAVAEAGGLGFGEAVGLSAETGEGMADLYTALQPLVDAAVAARGAVEAGRAHASDPSPSPPATVITAAPAAAPTTIRLAIVGLPNAGKSTLVNRLLGTPRSLTGPEPGLTRDAVRASFDWQGRRVEVIDTAGWVRRAAAAGGRVPGGGVLVDVPGACRGGGGATTRAQATNPAIPHPVSVRSAGPGAVALALEAQAQAERGVDVAHCVVLVTDAAGGRGGGAGSGPGVQADAGSTLARSQPPPPVLTRAEVAIASATVTEGRALVFVANKVDLLGSPGAAAAAAARLARDAAARVPDAAGAPCLAMSAETGAGVDALMPAIAAVHDAWTRRVPTSRLNAWLADTVRDLEQRGGGGGGRNRGSPASRDVARVRYVTQASTRPPAFVAFVRGGVADLAPTTVRMLKKRLSSTFGFEGVPLRVFVRGRPSGSGRGRGGQTRRQPGRMRRGGS